jgi:four helix bundle protein
MFPRAERFGITDQLRRAAVSIPANISEGSRRGSDADMARFCHIALASAAEAEYFLILAGDLKFLPDANRESLNQKVQEVMRMLNGLIRSLKARDPRPETRD